MPVPFYFLVFETPRQRFEHINHSATFPRFAALHRGYSIVEVKLLEIFYDTGRFINYRRKGAEKVSRVTEDVPFGISTRELYDSVSVLKLDSRRRWRNNGSLYRVVIYSE